MYCEKCGAKLNDDASFCHKCGAEVLLEKENNETIQIESYTDEEKDVEYEKVEVDVVTDDGIVIEKIKRLKYPVIPIIISILLIVLQIISVSMIVNLYTDLDIAQKNLSNNTAVQKEVHQISSGIDKNISEHDGITERLIGLTESYTDEDLKDIDNMVSRLNAIEGVLETKYKDIGKLYGHTYDVFDSEDYSVEERDDAIISWKRVREKNNDSPTSIDTYSDMSAEERMMMDLDNDIDEYVDDAETDTTLILELQNCALSNYDEEYFNEIIDDSVENATEYKNFTNIKIIILWIVIVVITILLFASIFKVITYKKKIYKRMVRSSFTMIGIILMVISLFLAYYTVSNPVSKYITHSVNATDFEEHISKSSGEVKIIDKTTLPAVFTYLGLDGMDSKIIAFSWENADGDRVATTMQAFYRALSKELYIVLIYLTITLILITCTIDCFIKRTKPKSVRSPQIE